MNKGADMPSNIKLWLTRILSGEKPHEIVVNCNNQPFLPNEQQDLDTLLRALDSNQYHKKQTAPIVLEFENHQIDDDQAKVIRNLAKSHSVQCKLETAADIAENEAVKKYSPRAGSLCENEETKQRAIAALSSRENNTARRRPQKLPLENYPTEGTRKKLSDDSQKNITTPRSPSP